MVPNKGWIQHFFVHEVLYSMKWEKWIQRPAYRKDFYTWQDTHNKTDEFVPQQRTIVTLSAAYYAMQFIVLNTFIVVHIYIMDDIHSIIMHSIIIKKTKLTENTCITAN